MKAKELRVRESADLGQLLEALKTELFANRMKNLTNQLEDSNLLRRTRRDIARVETILRERAVRGTGS